MDGGLSYKAHAETSVLKHYRPGDKIVVVRFNKAGALTMAQPCKCCQKYLTQEGVKQVYYTDWDGKLQKLRM